MNAPVAADLKSAHWAAGERPPARELDEFAKDVGTYQAIGKLWKDNCDRVIPSCDFPIEVRRMICTTGAVQSPPLTLRQIIKMRGAFPGEEATLKLLCLSVRNVTGKWEAIQHWKQAPNHIEVLSGDRIRATTGGPDVAQSSPTGMRSRSHSRYAVRRDRSAMPERCSPARVRSAAPKAGAAMPATRRSGREMMRRAAPAEIGSGAKFGSWSRMA
jgi:hypothetical protein